MAYYYVLTRQTVEVTPHGVVGKDTADIINVYGDETEAVEAFEYFIDNGNEPIDIYNVDMDDKEHYLVCIRLEKVIDWHGETEDVAVIKEAFDIEIY